MGDFYTEQLVKKKTDGKDIALNILLIVLTVISFFIAFLMPLLILVPILFVVADVFLFGGWMWSTNTFTLKENWTLTR